MYKRQLHALARTLLIDPMCKQSLETVNEKHNHGRSDTPGKQKEKESYISDSTYCQTGLINDKYTYTHISVYRKESSFLAI